MVLARHLVVNQKLCKNQNCFEHSLRLECPVCQFSARVPCLLESLRFFLLIFPDPGKVLENKFGPIKCWKIKLKVLESKNPIWLMNLTGL